MGKNKDKAKDQTKSKNDDKPKRKELTQELEQLRMQNEALRARLDRIAEIAASDPELGEPNDVKPSV